MKNVKIFTPPFLILCACAAEKASVMPMVFISLGAVASLLLIMFVVMGTHSILKHRRKKQRYGDKK